MAWGVERPAPGPGAPPPDPRASSVTGVHLLDLAEVLVADRAALELHRRRQLVAAGQPVAANDREALYLLHARQSLVGGVDARLDRRPHGRLRRQRGEVTA